jgi:predicted nuclease of restriction endonuclease-like RecB superfamily
MLTGDLLRATFRGGRVRPRYVDPSDEALQGEVQELLAIFRAHVGKARGRLEEAIADHIGDTTDYGVRRGLVKLLMDRSTVEMVAPLPPAEIRKSVFLAAAQDWPVETGGATSASRESVLERAATALGITRSAAETSLYADLKAEHRLTAVDLPEAARLLDRYNLALAQAVLLRAHELVITLPDPAPKETRAIVRAMKFRGLLHRVERTGNTLVLRLDGPLSLFRQTQRYGLQLALFLPTVIALERFDLNAVIAWGKERKPATFSLTQADGLVPLRRERGLWESAEEKQLRSQWKKLDTPWKLERSSRIVDLGGRDLLVPDYVLRHPDGRKALVDLVWSWRRAAFERRLELLRETAPPNLIIAVALRRHVGEEESPQLPEGAVVPFKGVIQAKRLIEAAERVAC